MNPTTPAGAAVALPRALRPGFLAASTLILLALLGCSQVNPLDRKVEADSPVSFSMWRSKTEAELAPEQVEDLKQALQEMRFHIMAEGKSHGSEAIEDALMLEIDAQTLRQVVLRGLGYGLDRAEAERSALDDSLKKNAQMYTHPGDTASAGYLSDLRGRQVERLKAATEQVAKTRARLAANQAPMPK